MMPAPVFPTELHRAAADVVREYFAENRATDTILVVNSCARGQGTPDSDLDFAILAKPDVSHSTREEMTSAWESYAQNHPIMIEYKQSSPFAHVHLDIIDGIYTPTTWETGVISDYFELEIGNQICYSAPMGNSGEYFRELQQQWLPYYDEKLRTSRLDMIANACRYDLHHILIFVQRELYFQAFDILCQALKEYLHVLFIAHKTYPIAYNKWIHYQMTSLLKKPELYSQLAPILSVNNIASGELKKNVAMLQVLLDDMV